ncbi:MKI67 FHA domain-interacting nucleolar phosphoprotein isoform X2 [Rhodnius prolixus]|uniref:Putative nucleolar rna-binding protein nifk n=2 Tax=Rhodnius TaxID=13248 RepID=R4FKI2_RHOPR
MSPKKPISNSSTLISSKFVEKEIKKEGKKCKKRKQKKKLGTKGVVYFSHIPHGFYEEAVKSYCSQFGKVTGVHLPKSKKGNSRGYGFVEFQHQEVAQIVAETMNNYLMYGKILKAKYIPPSEQRPGVMRRAQFWDNKERAIKENEKTIHLMTRKLKPKEELAKVKRMCKNVEKHHEKLKSLGLDYEFQVESAPAVKTEDKEQNME